MHQSENKYTKTRKEAFTSNLTKYTKVILDMIITTEVQYLKELGER